MVRPERSRTPRTGRGQRPWAMLVPVNDFTKGVVGCDPLPLVESRVLVGRDVAPGAGVGAILVNRPAGATP